MNLSSRMSTAVSIYESIFFFEKVFNIFYQANIGHLDKPKIRDALVWGNLALLQVQALITGATAGLFTFVEGMVFQPHVISYFESMMVIVTSMICSALSSMVMGTLLCLLIICSRRFRINPGNISTFEFESMVQSPMLILNFYIQIMLLAQLQLRLEIW